MSCEYAGDDDVRIERYALGQLPGEEASAFEEHLLTCGACAERLDLVTRLRGALAHVAVEDLAPPPRLLSGPVWRSWALAAGVTLLLAGAAVLAGRQTRELTRLRAELGRTTTAVGEAEARLAAQQAAQDREQVRWSAEQAALAAELARAQGPQTGVVVLFLGVLRGGDEAPRARLEQPSGGRVVINLSVGPDAVAPLTLRLLRAGREVWSAADLAPDAAGQLAVSFPVADLPVGEYLAEVSTPRGRLGRYGFRVIPPPLR